MFWKWFVCVCQYVSKYPLFLFFPFLKFYPAMLQTLDSDGKITNSILIFGFILPYVLFYAWFCKHELQRHEYWFKISWNPKAGPCWADGSNILEFGCLNRMNNTHVIASIAFRKRQWRNLQEVVLIHSQSPFIRWIWIELSFSWDHICGFVFKR